MTGRFTGEIISSTLVLPSMNRFLGVYVFLFFFVKVVGEIHRVGEYFNSPSPLYEPKFWCCFEGVYFCAF